MKKWYLSKTILVAVAMEALAQVTLHMEEVKEAITSHINTDAGLAFAIVFPAVMAGMRFVTTKPIEGVKKNVQEPNERDDRDDQDMDDDSDDDRDSGDGVVGLIPKTISDSDTGADEQNSKRDDQNQRLINRDAKPRGRAKRRGWKKG